MDGIREDGMVDYTVRIGLVPIRRDVSPRPGIFNAEKGEERGRKAVSYIKTHFSNPKVGFVDLEGINPQRVLFKDEDAAKVIEKFKHEKVDGIVLINGNFGNEAAAAQVAHETGKPVVLWAPLDDVFEADGTRYSDSQCGIFGASRQLQRRNVPFTFVETCSIEDEVFRKGILGFFSVCCMVKNFRGLRVAQVGMRPPPFSSVIFNEDELLRLFDIQVVPVNLAVAVDKYKRLLAEKKKELAEGAALLASRYEMDLITPPLLEKVYAFVLLYEEIFKQYDVRALSAECWTAMQLAVGAMPCTAYSILADMGYIVSCESDLHGALTMLILSCASRGEKIPFFGEFTVRHPENKQGELLWHCGPFAYSLKAADSKAKNVNMRQWFRVKDGLYTIARMDQEKGIYSLLSGTFKTTRGPYTFGTYLWAEFDKLTKWERKLVEGPYIHHMAEIEGDYTWELREFCKYVPNLKPDWVE
jgi:L-fucose isomerase-like protein